MLTKTIAPFAMITTMLASSCQHTSAANDLHNFRMQEPKATGKAPPLRAPIPEREILSNGLTVLVVPVRELPLVYAEVVIRSGSADDPQSKKGLAGFMTSVLREGTKSRSAEAIAEEIEALGSSLHVGTDEESISLSFSALTENFASVFDVVADVLMNPQFDPTEVERMRKRRLAALAQSRFNPRSTASRVFRKTVFGNHPYAHSSLGEQSTIEKVKAKDLRRYYKRHLNPNNAAVIIVGDVGRDEAVEEVIQRLASWDAKGGTTTPPNAAKDESPGLFVVDKPSAPQSQLRIGHLGVSRKHPDYHSIVICNAILGGLFNSRINMNLREDKGYTYGARSVFDFLRGRGSFFVYTGVRTDVTAAAIQEVLTEIDGIRKADVTQTELRNAKNQYSLSLPGYFQTVSGIGGMMTNIFLYDLPLDYYQELPNKISAVTIQDVRRVAKAHLRPKNLSIVVVGDRDKIDPELQKLDRGTIQSRDPDGNPISPAG